ncbi:MAG: alanyl-tRNA editing protein [Thermoplasmatota archaeon]
MVEALWLRENPRTCLATVLDVRGSWFFLDRSIFCPGSSRFRHPQPADRGLVWVGGDKRRIERVEWRGDQLWHSIGDRPPPTGTRLRCHLDVDRRERTEAAHTALHLVVSALARSRGPIFTAPPRTQGGGQFTLTLRRDTFDPAVVANAVQSANEGVKANLAVASDYRLPQDVRDLDRQPFSDAAGLATDAPARIVRIGTASVLPCDGTLCDRTGAVGGVALRASRPTGGDVVLAFVVQ